MLALGVNIIFAELREIIGSDADEPEVDPTDFVEGFALVGNYFAGDFVTGKGDVVVTPGWRGGVVNREAERVGGARAT